MSDHRPVKTALNAFAYIVTCLAALATIWAFWQPGSVTDVLERLQDTNAEISDATQRTATATEDIRTALGAPAQETSADPVRELANRGYPLTQSGFVRAVDAGDTQSVALYCQTGRAG